MIHLYSFLWRFIKNNNKKQIINTHMQNNYLLFVRTSEKTRSVLFSQRNFWKIFFHQPTHYYYIAGCN